MILFVSLVILSSCRPSRKSGSQPPDELVSHIDSTIRPGNDFFLFANGKWFTRHPIPSTEQQNGLWEVIQDTINDQIKAICTSSAALTDASTGSNKQKIGDFFFSGMDSLTINRKGLSDLKPELDRINTIENISQLTAEAARLHLLGCNALFRFMVGQDDKISSKMAIFIFQGGLSLPDRSFYLDPDSRSKKIRQQFSEHLVRAFRIIGYKDPVAVKASANLVKIETALARSSRKREDTRDPWKNYNKIPFRRLATLAPAVDWKKYIDVSGLQNADTVIVGQPEFLTALNGYLKTFPLEAWKDYLKYKLIRDFAPYADDNTNKEFFRFYSTDLRGIPEQRPRWKRVVMETDSDLGDLVGQVYSEDYLPAGTKQKLQEIGNAIKEVYAERIKALDWMSESTKAKALDKLNAVVMKLGYPDKWKDMSAFQVDRSSYIKNVMAANEWETRYRLSKFGKPVDRTEWGMEPQTYNAYYNPSNNEIVIPGCNILIPGYEHRLPDDALLYGIIGGSTFGHEITHGFDDQGSKYDKNGNLRNWWTKDDSTNFYARTRRIVQQYNDYVAVDSLHINGENTQGENIADLGGIMMGYEAFKKTDQYKNHEMIAGLTPDQRFFLGYALAWMVNQRPEALAVQVKSNEHSPPKFRVLGPLSNMPAFYEAFHVEPGDAMYRPDSLRIRIW